jgi:UDP-2-acetamido-2,6-beta-L-arabino-hexul-4-ose reductase
MKILVTGSAGFIGKNLCCALSERPGIEIHRHDIDDPEESLHAGLSTADLIFHLAGVNRPPSEKDFEPGNYGLTARILRFLEQNGRNPPVVLSSSTQAGLENPYGTSKKKAEEEAVAYATRRGTRAYIYRLTNIFGKWSRPFYNSVVSTFCYQAARDKAMHVDDPGRVMRLVHVDDVVSSFTGVIEGRTPLEKDGFCVVEPVYSLTLGDLAVRLKSFRQSRTTSDVPDFSDPFTRRLYSTYLSYLENGDFVYAADRKSDTRGYLFELVKSAHAGQIFISRTLPGITRGNHYHHAKVEKFCVVEGSALVTMRSLATRERVAIPVEGRECRIVDIPPGWVHAIRNVGTSDLVTVFWANEVFNRERPDTFASEV